MSHTDQPDPTSSGGDKTGVAGGSVTLSCSCPDRGYPAGSYKWGTPKEGTKDTGSTGQLTIDELSVNTDDGEYTCYVENSVDAGTSATVTLTVHSEYMYMYIQTGYLQLECVIHRHSFVNLSLTMM